MIINTVEIDGKDYDEVDIITIDDVKYAYLIDSNDDGNLLIQKIVLKDGKEAYLRNGVASDGNAVFENFNLTHAETDYLLSYPDENSFNSEQEGQFLEQKTESTNEIIV